jgi:hypothetical protein
MNGNRVVGQFAFVGRPILAAAACSRRRKLAGEGQPRYGFRAVGRNSSRSRLNVTRIAWAGCDCSGR